MELRGLHRSTAHPPVHGFRGEKEQMLNLNQRLETYLNRVKLLDEENAKLVREIQARREEHHFNLERRKFLDEELRSARLEVDEMWKQRVYAEADVARLSEELQSLDLELRKETQAQVEARAMAEQSRRELEEERRAQMWLREKVNQLESEMKSLIQSHQEEVAHVEALLMRPRDVRPPPAAAAFQHGPNLLELGQEYSQRAARAWQEAAQSYQGQLNRLEESVEETRQKLVRVNKEKSEGALKLQNLDRELLGLEEQRGHLEMQLCCNQNIVQQTQTHRSYLFSQSLDLEREKQALAQKMEQLLQENRGLVQMKMALNMEVATYR
uniref:IF rod domain-containing protein n=1 Tax=Neogobius melanostomus TaxID=47308 RepID=A0A8C6S531_9GOBI